MDFFKAGLAKKKISFNMASCWVSILDHTQPNYLGLLFIFVMPIIKLNSII